MCNHDKQYIETIHDPANEGYSIDICTICGETFMVEVKSTIEKDFQPKSNLDVA